LLLTIIGEKIMDSYESGVDVAGDSASAAREEIPRAWLRGDDTRYGVDNRTFAEYCQEQQEHSY
jgi:hypothetical protein